MYSKKKVKQSFEENISELFKDFPKIPSVEETPEIKVAKYRHDMFIKCPDGSLHEWDSKLYILPKPRMGNFQVCKKCGECKSRDTSD